LCKNANFFAKYFGENIQKIVTLVPGQMNRFIESVPGSNFLTQASSSEYRSRLHVHALKPKVVAIVDKLRFPALFPANQKNFRNGWIRVARRYIFKPKISIWVNFGGY
jgi:hypothetical protein